MKQNSPKILIIDNDESLTEAISIRMNAHGFNCETASCGAQGVARFQEDEFDAVLTDLNMPSGNGVSVIRSIRSVSDVPVLVITGFESAFADELDDFGNISVIRKPFDIETIIDDIEVAINMGQFG